jgi:hypothetical protein
MQKKDKIVIGETTSVSNKTDEITLDGAIIHLELMVGYVRKRGYDYDLDAFTLAIIEMLCNYLKGENK